MLREAINLGNPILAHADATTGEPGGVSVDLARAFARWLGLPVEFVVFKSAGESVQADFVEAMKASGFVQQALGGLENPSFLALNHRGDRLYTVHGDGSGCSVLDVDATNGRLTLLQTQDFTGRNPVHLALDPPQRHLIVSSHLTGEVVVMPVDDKGLLSAPTQRVSLPGGPGPHRVEQPFSKPHHNPFDPSGRFVIVPDKGLDRIFVFRYAHGHLAPAEVPWTQAREGAGPRHVAVHPTGHWVYAVNELDSTVTACVLDATSGEPKPFQWAPLLPGTFLGNSRAAGIEISRDGCSLYASNRGCETIEAFPVDAATGRLVHAQSRSSEGRTPRFFTRHPGGQALYALNEDSDSIVVIDCGAGLLGKTMHVMRCNSPVCMVFGAQGQPIEG